MPLESMKYAQPKSGAQMRLPAIEISDVRKKFEKPALRGVSLSIAAGELFGILGPNGAGKTTLLNCIGGLLTPDTGGICVLGEGSAGGRASGASPSPERCEGGGHGDSSGQTPCTVNRRLRERINLCSGHANFPWSLAVSELLRFYGMLYGLWGGKLEARINELLDLLELANYRDRKFEELSTGTKQRVALAKSLVNAPEVLLLDEPTVGLDPDVAMRIRALIRRLHKERRLTIILTTHYMAEADELCGRIAFMHTGQIKALGSPAELKRRTKSPTLEKAFLALAQSP